jgi:hypothetical protein
MSGVFRMRTLRPHWSVAKQVVRPCTNLFGFLQDFVNGLNDSVQSLRVFHTDTASKPRAH